MSKLSNTTHLKNKTSFHLSSWNEAFNSLDIGISIISEDLQLEYINEAYRKLVGIPPHIKPQCAALDMYLLIAERGDMGPGDPHLLARNRLAELKKGGGPEIIQNSIPGNTCKVDRKIIANDYILTSVTDITKNATSEAMLSSIIHSAEHGIMIVNNQGAVEFYNNTFADMFVGIAIPQNDNPTFFDYFYEAWKSGKLAGDFYGVKMSALSEEEFLANTNQFCDASMSSPQKIRLSGGKHLCFTSEFLDGNRKLLSFKDTTEKVLHAVEVNRAQQRSEDALNDFRVAFDNMDVGLVLLDKNLKILLINDAFHDIWNTHSTEIHTGKDFRTLIDINRKNGIYDVRDEDWDDYVGARLLEIQAGAIIPREFERADGKILIYSCTALSDGQRLVKYSDITEFKNREKALEQAQMSAENMLGDFSAAINNMDVGLVLLDKDLNTLLINDTFHDIWKTNSGNFQLGQSFRYLMDDNRKNKTLDIRDENSRIKDEDWEEYVQSRLSEIKKGSIAPREFERADGKILIYSCTALSDGQRLIRYSDITEFKNREKALEQAQISAENMLADFSAAINNMDVGLVLVDKNLNTLLINDAFHEIWNTNAGNFKLGQSFRNLMDINRKNGIYDVEDEDWEDYVQMRMEEIRSGSIASREFIRADGKVLIYSNTELSGGQRLISYTNITEFKQREEELKKAQFLAESADRSKSEFLANMSHEIRTPMNGVMGMAELLGKTQLDSKQKMFTDVILSSSTALLTIINDILDFSKIEAGKLELDLGPFCLSAVIEDIATLVSTGVVEKNLELIVRVQPGLANNLIGDAGRFRQILTNLVGNAVKFTETGHVLVDVSGSEENGIVHLKCSVQDTGIGIPEEQLDTVFEKFSQVDASSTRRHEGTGLGLAITTRLINLMGGEVDCQSILGEGSTFWFSISLPVDKNALPVISSPVNISGARALAIDDNSVNRSILLEQFEAWDLAGQAAASGLEGLAMLRNAMGGEHAYEVVVLDFHMPDMNGLEVARVIRSDEKLQNTPIVMLTSVDNIAESENFKALNIDAHLTKPARASQLLESIVNVLREPLGHAKYNRKSVSDPIQKTGEQRSLPVSQGQTQRQTENVTLEETPLAPCNPPDIFNNTPASPSATNALITDNPPHQISSNESSNICILVAEDNEVNQLVFTQILEYMNFDFKIVENGKLAVEAALESRPKVILMDVSMPVMNGLDAAREIRKLCAPLTGSDAYKPIIIAVTAHALKDDREKCFAAGMDDYMSKPISPDMLIKKIKHWVPEFEEKPEQLLGKL